MCNLRFLALLVLLTPTLIFAQTTHEKMACGNKSSGTIQTSLVVNQLDEHPKYRINLNENGEIPVVVYYAYDPSKVERPTSVTHSQLKEIFNELNSKFGDPFHFIIDKTIEVNDSYLHIIEGELGSIEYQDVYSMFQKNPEDEFKIHVYFPYDSKGICGLSSFPISDEQGIIVASTFECAGSENKPKAQVLIHEMGHFFNLHHTFYNSDDSEMAERVMRDRRCTSQGDGFCDTPADFYPSFRHEDLENPSLCRLRPAARFTDDEGRLYNPSISNFMSYFSNDCLTDFTLEQRAMLKEAFYYRTYQPFTFEEFSIYPNPASPSDNIRINMDIGGIEDSDLILYQLQIFNSAGQEISSQTMIGSNDAKPTLNSLQGINMSFAASGTYVVNLILTNVRTQQVIYKQAEQLVIVN